MSPCSFSVSLLQHRIWGPSVVGSFVPLLHSPAWFMLEVLNAHTTWLSQSATAFLPGEPWKTPTCTPQTTSNTNQPDTWLVLHHISGALGCQSLEQACPLLLQASPTYNGYLSTLPGRRQLATQDCSRKTAHCQEVPDKWPNLSLPPRPRKNFQEERSRVVCTFFSGWGSNASFFSCLMQWHRYFVLLILNQAICHQWNRF